MKPKEQITKTKTLTETNTVVLVTIGMIGAFFVGMGILISMSNLSKEPIQEPTVVSANYMLVNDLTYATISVDHTTFHDSDNLSSISFAGEDTNGNTIIFGTYANDVQGNGNYYIDGGSTLEALPLVIQIPSETHPAMLASIHQAGFETSPTCIDDDPSYGSDSYGNVHLSGSVYGIDSEGVSYSHNDWCAGDNIQLQEQFCYSNPNGEGILNGQAGYNCQNECINGLCLGPDIPFCIDSQPNNDPYYQAGFVQEVDNNGNFTRYEDACSTTINNQLKMYSCIDAPNGEGDVMNEITFDCPNGCENGICKTDQDTDNQSIFKNWDRIISSVIGINKAEASTQIQVTGTRSICIPEKSSTDNNDGKSTYYVDFYGNVFYDINLTDQVDDSSCEEYRGRTYSPSDIYSFSTNEELLNEYFSFTLAKGWDNILILGGYNSTEGFVDLYNDPFYIEAPLFLMGGVGTSDAIELNSTVMTINSNLGTKDICFPKTSLAENDSWFVYFYDNNGAPYNDMQLTDPVSCGTPPDTCGWITDSYCTKYPNHGCCDPAVNDSAR